MKKIILLAASVVMAAATSFAQLSYGIQGTGNLSDARLKFEDAYNPAKKMQAMPGGGVIAQYAFSEKFAVRSGVNFLQHGVKLKIDYPGSGIEDPAFNAVSTTKLNYVQVPVNLLFTKTLAGLQFFAGGGGFINYGIGGKVTLNGEYNVMGSKEAFSEESKPFDSEDKDSEFKKTDAGLGALAGLRLRSGLFMNVGYQYSLTNSSPKNDDGKYKNNGLQLSIGFLF